MRGLLLIVVLAASVSAQEIQVKRVYDFSGGLMNSISNAAMRDNMALVLENYDIDPFGNLKRRLALTPYAINTGIDYIYAIIPRISPNGKQLWILARRDAALKSELIGCDNAALTCDSTWVTGLYQPSTDWIVPYNYDVVEYQDQLYVASTNSELMVYRDSVFYPARPRAPSQANVTVRNSGTGNLKGTFRYKYLYIDTTVGFAGGASNLSAPTWPVTVNYGNVRIWDIWDGGKDSIKIYREKNFSGNYEHLVTLDSAVASYLDNIAATSPADTFAYRWGPNRHCCGASAAADAPQDPTPEIGFSLAPGAMSVSIAGGNDTVGHGKPNDQADDSFKRFFMAWSVVFVDTAGRHSYMSTPTCIGELHRFTSPTDSMQDLIFNASLSNIPVPHDSGIVKKLILRMHSNDQYTKHQHTDSGWLNRYVVIDTVDPDRVGYTDSIQYNATWDLPSYDASSGGCMGRDPADTIDYILGDSSWAHFLRYDSIGDIPELACYDDSLIPFQPMSIALHGTRLYGIGDPSNNNSLYYSLVHRLTTWPYNQYVVVPSHGNDWFVDLLTLEDRLILFRQNSIVQLQGHSFYQYSLDELIDNVGLTAPRSVVRIGNTVYFYHSTGVYTLSAFGGVSSQPLSFSIRKSLDSFMVNQQRAVGAGIAGDYWLSVDYATGNQTTYIYSEIPIPHWKAYGFGLHAVVQHDPDTIYANYNPNKWLIALVSGLCSGDNTVLYQWQLDRLSGFQNIDTIDICYQADSVYVPIIGTYQSKRFFEGRERERIYWLDIIGEGTADTITFTFLDEGVPFDTVAFLPDFTDDKRDRIIVDRIVHDFAVRWEDNGHGQYQIDGYEIGWIPWDRGRPAP